MKKLFLLCLVVWNWFNVATAWARLGETREECITRYGQPFDKTDTDLFFRKNDITVKAEFDNAGHTTKISFSGHRLKQWPVANHLVGLNLGSTTVIRHSGHNYWWLSKDHTNCAHWVGNLL